MIHFLSLRWVTPVEIIPYKCASNVNKRTGEQQEKYQRELIQISYIKKSKF